jgi:hypothetical protein
MTRYLVERSFPDGLAIPIDDRGAKGCQNVVDGNAEHGVTWLHSHVNPDHKATYCSYDGRLRNPSGSPPRPTAYRSTASPRSASWTRTSTTDAKGRSVAEGLVVAGEDSVVIWLEAIRAQFAAAGVRVS